MGKLSIVTPLILLLSLPGYATGPITVSVISGLAFGKFAAGSGGTVIMSPASSRSRTGSVSLLSSVKGNAARVRINGDAGASYIMTLPTDNEASLTSSSGSMSLSSFTSNPSLTGALDGTGTQYIDIGATLTVDAFKQASDYSGTFTVYVDYQ